MPDQPPRILTFAVLLVMLVFVILASRAEDKGHKLRFYFLLAIVFGLLALAIALPVLYSYL